MQENQIQELGETSCTNLDTQSDLFIMWWLIQSCRLHSAIECEILDDGGEDENKINSRVKGESFSVSKIWLWSKKGKFPNSHYSNDVNGILP